MAFASSFRRVLTGSGGTLFSQHAPIRFNSTLTSPKLFISGLNGVITDEKLKDTFSPFGQVLEAKVVTDRATGRSKGFGFVQYMTIEEADKARKEMNAKFVEGWAIFVDPAKPRELRT